MSVFDAHLVLQALIHLNEWEDELKSLGPRSGRRQHLVDLIAVERPKVAPFILAHHDRIRARGKSSTAPVRDWICRSCFISVPIGLRTNLSNGNDLCVCENCGAYIFLPSPEQQAALEEAAERRRQAAQSLAAEHAAAKPTVPANSPTKAKKKSPKDSSKTAKKGTKPSTTTKRPARAQVKTKTAPRSRSKTAAKTKVKAKAAPKRPVLAKSHKKKR